MNNHIATEALIQRGRTPFYNDLISLYQSTFDALKNDPKPSAETINLTLKHIDFDKNIKALVLKHMGLKLDRLVIVEGSSPNMMFGLFYNSVFIKNMKNHTQTPGMMIEDINRLYDDRIGFVDNKDDRKFAHDFDLFIHTGFWSTKDSEGNSYFTAEEMAAITLHELGHGDHWIRTFNRIYHRMLDASDIIDYLKVSYDRDVVLALLKTVKNSRYFDKSWSKVLDVTEKYFLETNSADDPKYWEALSAVVTIFTADIAAYNLNYANMKLTTNLHVLDTERSADDFSARHGAYAAMVSSVLKLEKLQTLDSKHIFRQTMFSGAALIFGSLQKFSQYFNIQAEEISQGYDPLIRRMSLIVETAKHAFHDANLPDDIKLQIKQQIEESEDYIRQYQSSSHHKARLAIKTWKDNIGKFGRIIVFPLRNPLSQDYERLQDANRSLSRHPLYYLANK